VEEAEDNPLKKETPYKEPKMNKNRKVLILSCGTGGGHNSAARAIQESLIEKGIEADFVEYLDIINPKIKDSINHLYIKTTKRNGKVFKVVYRLGELYEKTKIKSPVYRIK
jgi:processive 1,2-diacylglycerol beta-glucosyltransferase